MAAIPVQWEPPHGPQPLRNHGRTGSPFEFGGSLVGNALASRINQTTLKRIFAVFLIAMAGYILARQAPRVMPDVFGPVTSNAPAAPTSTGSRQDP